MTEIDRVKQIKHLATKMLAMKPEFDVARDEDSNPVGTTKFCMISVGEWEDVRTLATALLEERGEGEKNNASAGAAPLAAGQSLLPCPFCQQALIENDDETGHYWVHPGRTKGREECWLIYAIVYDKGADPVDWNRRAAADANQGSKTSLTQAQSRSDGARPTGREDGLREAAEVARTYLAGAHLKRTGEDVAAKILALSSSESGGDAALISKKELADLRSTKLALPIEQRKHAEARRRIHELERIALSHPAGKGGE